MTTSRYPTLSTQFNPTFATHDDDDRIPVGAYRISQDLKIPGCEAQSSAVGAIIFTHPNFPIA